MGKWNEKSSNLSNDDFCKHLSTRGSELMMQWLFYMPDNVKIHEKIITASKKLTDKVGLFFSMDNIHPSDMRNDRKDLLQSSKYCLWKSKGNPEKSRRWQSDGSIMEIDDGRPGKKVAIVEFKSFNNMYLKHNDIAKLVQYLVFAHFENFQVMYITRKTFIEDICWMAKRFTDGRIDEEFFKICDSTTRESPGKGPPLSEQREFKKGTNVDDYNPPKFKALVVSRKDVITSAFQNNLSCINIDIGDDLNKTPVEVINLNDTEGVESGYIRCLMKFLLISTKKNS